MNSMDNDRVYKYELIVHSVTDLLPIPGEKIIAFFRSKDENRLYQRICVFHLVDSDWWSSGRMCGEPFAWAYIKGITEDLWERIDG